MKKIFVTGISVLIVCSLTACSSGTSGSMSSSSSLRSPIVSTSSDIALIETQTSSSMNGSNETDAPSESESVSISADTSYELEQSVSSADSGGIENNTEYISSESSDTANTSPQPESSANIPDIPQQPQSTAPPGQTSEPENTDDKENNKMKITVGNTEFTATLADNSSVAALKELLADSPLTIDMHDYGNFEKVGSIGTSLPRNNEQIATTAGDIILYQGNSLVIYYDRNSWNFTRIGWIDNVSQSDLKAALGDGNVTVTFSLD